MFYLSLSLKIMRQHKRIGQMVGGLCVVGFWWENVKERGWLDCLLMVHVAN